MSHMGCGGSKIPGWKDVLIEKSGKKNTKANHERHDDSDQWDKFSTIGYAEKIIESLGFFENNARKVISR
jgi:hypothetical protein